MKTEFEDWLTELPPIDGGEDEADAGDAIADELLPDETSEASLDDATADDLDIGLGLDITEETHGAGDEDDKLEVDVGEPELDIREDEAAADAEPASMEDELDAPEELPHSDDDGGEEGTTDPIEHYLDQELPAMDADGDGDFEDTILAETSTPDTDEAMSLRWADAAWAEDTARLQPLSWAERDPIVAGALHPSGILCAIGESGALFVSRDGGRSVAAKVRALPWAREARPPLLAITQRGGRVKLWLSQHDGRVASSDDGGQSFSTHGTIGGGILTMAAREDGSLACLVRTPLGLELATTVDGSDWFTQKLSGDVGELTMPRVVRASFVSLRGSGIAVGDSKGVLLARDGKRLSRVGGTEGASACVFAGSSERSPLLIAGVFVDEAVHLVRVPADGEAEIVAEVAASIDSEDGEDAVLALAWDGERARLLWRNRVSCFSPAPPSKTTPR